MTQSRCRCAVGLLFAALITLASLPAAAQSADLAITKTAPFSDPLYAGENTVFKLQVTNNGPATASNVTVTDPLPAGLTYQGVDAPGFNCSAPPVGTNGTVTCTAGSMAPNSPTLLYIFVGVPSGAPGGTSFNNTATIASATSDPTPGNNSSMATLTVSGGSVPPNDMQITKLAPTIATPGQAFTYQLSFGSNLTQKSNVTVTDALPAGITFQSVSVTSPSPGFTCTTPAVGANGTVQCFTPLMFLNPFSEIDIVVNVDPSVPAGTNITNTATVSSTTPDPNSSNNSSFAVTVVVSPNSADLAITKIIPYPDLAYAGENTVFHLQVSNNGPATASNVTVTDALPPGLTYQGVDAPGFNCSGPPVGTNGTVTCTTASLPPNSPMLLYVFVGVPSGTPGGTSFTNTATIGSATSDPVPANNSATASFTVNGGSVPPNDMQIIKSAPTTATPGQTITYQLSFGSNSTTKSNVTVTDVLPAGITFQSVSVDNLTPEVSCTTPAVGANGTVQCSTPLMFNFPFGLIDIVVNVDPSVPAGTNITNTATVSSTTPDPNSSNNSSFAVTVVASPNSADVAITKSAPLSNSYAGENTVFQLQVTNNGPATASNVTVTDPLPPGLTYQGVDAQGFNCSGPPVGTNGTVTCTAASLPPNSPMPLYVFVGVPSGTPGGTSFTNTATAASATSDPVPANNSATATLTISGGSVPPNDMQIIKSAPTTATPGQAITYQLSFGSGSTTKSNVTVTDVLPTGITFQSVSVNSHSPGLTCTTPAVGANGTVQCFTPLMFVNPFSEVDVVVKVDPSVPVGTNITNTASVSSTTPDPNSSNNSSFAVTPIVAASDLTITKTHSGSFFRGQTGASYVLTVKNAGTAPTSGIVTVTDTLPAGMTATAMSGTGWSCTVASATCTRSDVLAVGASYPPITLTVDVASNAAATVTNTATVSGGGELITTNDTATDVTPIVALVPALDELALAFLAILLCAVALIKVR